MVSRTWFEQESYLSLPESHQCRGSKSLQFYGTVQTNSLGQNSILCTEIKKNSLGSTIHLITKTTEENTKKKHPYYCYLSLEKRTSSKFIWLVSRSFIRPI